MNVEFSLIGRLLLAAIFGGIIGYERESRRHPAGLRTHILVAMGSCLVMIISMFGFQMISKTWDPGRLAAQVVSGIGFLGAGTILREGPTIKGLTTAATLWVVAGIGLSVGCGFYVLGFATTTLSWITLTFLDILEKKLISPELLNLEVKVEDTSGELGKFCSLIGKYVYNIKHIEIVKIDEGYSAVLDVLINVKNADRVEALSKLSNISCVKSIRLKDK